MVILQCVVVNDCGGILLRNKNVTRIKLLLDLTIEKQKTQKMSIFQAKQTKCV
ncbi:hypothetical protein SKA34_12270 [Photobacterium sp. SKA34]|nr:hypothetical protein SKA34_12270 [Photobacterium sp. SKA34]